jgi:ribosome-binding protein aMBF1 (putative translation factor)
MGTRLDTNLVPQNGPAIREIRVREGLSVSDLAQSIDISDSHLRNIEMENRAASEVHMARIAKKLNCSLAAIRRRIDAAASGQVPA